jgi:PPOX class probable FMN-dependent enzyme
MDAIFDEVITTRTRLRELMRETGPVTGGKDADHINEPARQFIAHSPFLILSTIGKDGRIDSSPKGDPPGFVEVLDKHTLIIPDRLGNHRLDSYENILVNPAVGLIFMIPGFTETLRMAGTARIIVDSGVQERHKVNGKAPVLALAVTITEAFMHCSKAFVRSRLWKQEQWPSLEGVPTLADWVKCVVPIPDSLETVQGWHDRDARDRLY